MIIVQKDKHTSAYVAKLWRDGASPGNPISSAIDYLQVSAAGQTREEAVRNLRSVHSRIKDQATLDLFKARARLDELCEASLIEAKD